MSGHKRNNSLFMHDSGRGAASALDIESGRINVARHMNQTFSSKCRQDKKTMQKFGPKYDDEDKIKHLMRQIKLK